MKVKNLSQNGAEIPVNCVSQDEVIRNPFGVKAHQTIYFETSRHASGSPCATDILN